MLDRNKVYHNKRERERERERGVVETGGVTVTGGIITPKIQFLTDTIVITT